MLTKSINTLGQKLNLCKNNLIAILQKRWPCLILALIIYVIQILVIQGKVRAIFTLPESPRLYVYGILILAGIFGVSFYVLFFALLQNLYYKDKKTLIYAKYFLVYFGIMGVFFLLTWPGIFKGDEFYVLRSALTFELSPAQSGITSIFYIVCLLFFPSMATITFVQLIIICGIFSYIMYHMNDIFHSRRIWFLLIPFLLLPVIDGNLFTLRATLVGWLFLLLLFRIYFAYKNKSLSLPAAVFLGLLSGLLTAWRSEYIYLFLFLPLALCLLKLVRLKRSLLVTAVILAAFLVLNLPNRIAANGSNKYPISLVLNPVANLFTEEHLDGPQVYEDILTINELVDVQLLRQNASVRNISQYWNIPDILPKEQLDRFMTASLRIIMYNFDDFLKYRFQTFAYTNSLHPDRINHPGGEGVESINRLVYYDTDYKELFAFSSPVISQNLREDVISFLACRQYIPDAIKTNRLVGVFYNCIPAFVLLCIVLLWSFLRKDKAFSILCLLTLIQLPLIFLTAPAMFFMYYFCFYLCSYVLVTLFILERIPKRVSLIDSEENNSEKIDSKI